MQSLQMLQAARAAHEVATYFNVQTTYGTITKRATLAAACLTPYIGVCVCTKINKNCIMHPLHNAHICLP